MEKKTKPKGEKLAKEKGESLSRSKRAGLTFPVARLHRHLRGSSGINAEYGVPLPAVDIVGPTLIVPFTVTPNILQDIIEANANNIMEEHKLLRDSVSFVRQELGLQELHYLSPPELLEEHLVECINRLYKHIGILKPYTPGLRLLIANDYGYNIESQTVSIRWDYCVERNQS
eukprot:TRINITY_DN4516_c0_g1_i7.p1 TRINITY_DN4516_c0_g1~~TRINITY_DN4516_c0_g1_i7.p1  ORF type:complete len:173 (+),score=32.25 TRINITY_DN4516_c0_g1_i7:3-521(+)